MNTSWCKQEKTIYLRRNMHGCLIKTAMVIKDTVVLVVKFNYQKQACFDKDGQMFSKYLRMTSFILS